MRNTRFGLFLIKITLYFIHTYSEIVDIAVSDVRQTFLMLYLVFVVAIR